jgi:hypothetical protein
MEEKELGDGDADEDGDEDGDGDKVYVKYNQLLVAA